jgi:hypothetical protein
VGRFEIVLYTPVNDTEVQDITHSEKKFRRHEEANLDGKSEQVFYSSRMVGNRATIQDHASSLLKTLNES